MISQYYFHISKDFIQSCVDQFMSQEVSFSPHYSIINIFTSINASGYEATFLRI